MCATHAMAVIFDGLIERDNLPTKCPDPELLAWFKTNATFKVELIEQATLTLLIGEFGEPPTGVVRDEGANVRWQDTDGNYFVIITHPQGVNTVIMFRRQFTGPMYLDFLMRFLV